MLQLSTKNLRAPFIKRLFWCTPVLPIIPDSGRGCRSPGYEEFNPAAWPSACGPDKEDWIEVGSHKCNSIDREWGNLFWNCADIALTSCEHSDAAAGRCTHAARTVVAADCGVGNARLNTLLVLPLLLSFAAAVVVLSPLRTDPAHTQVQTLILCTGLNYRRPLTQYSTHVCAFFSPWCGVCLVCYIRLL